GRDRRRARGDVMAALSLPTSPLNATPEDSGAAAERAAKALEATLVRQLLSASGAFKGTDVAGASIHADMFVEALANAVAESDSLGLADMLTRNMPESKGAAAAPTGAADPH